MNERIAGSLAAPGGLPGQATSLSAWTDLEGKEALDKKAPRLRAPFAAVSLSSDTSCETSSWSIAAAPIRMLRGRPVDAGPGPPRLAATAGQAPLPEPRAVCQIREAFCFCGRTGMMSWLDTSAMYAPRARSR